MGTGIAWLLNLDAERELDDPARYASPPAMVARMAGLRERMTALLGADDRVLGSEPAEACALALAFCPTPRALERIRRAGFTPPPAPPLEVLRRVNARAFCSGLGQTLPQAAYVRSLEELGAALARADGAWLLKRDFGFAGRERRRVDVAGGRALDAPSLGFARRSFERGQGLQVEPLVARTFDLAQHGYLTRAGALLLGAPMRQHCDRHGSWEYSEPLLEPLAEAAALRASVEQVAEALHGAGYFGPFGVDAYGYLDRQARPAFQPRSEVNARFSMAYPRGLLERALVAEGMRG
jgi:hypothetical protein